MALNPFFIQGSKSEQRLIQNLVNEQLKIYGVEVTYIPRKFVRRDRILREITSSKFDDSFLIEAYVNNYDGYGGAGDILTKFGMSLRDELSLVISREVFENFIAPFLKSENDDEIPEEVSHRPKEGDLIYFPLGKRLFEVKFVEHEQPFYQLGKNYVYELKCELFEYEDEILDTTIEEIDDLSEGSITTLNLLGIGKTALASATIGTGYVREIFINNDGSKYKYTPTITFSPSPVSGGTAIGIGILTTVGGVTSLEKILLTSSGYGYTEAPTIKITDGGGSGAAATCSIETVRSGVTSITVTDLGDGYPINPLIILSTPLDEVGYGITATAVSFINNETNSLSSIKISNPGIGYSQAPIVTVTNPPLITGIGTYLFNEIVIGSQSGAKGRVKSWNAVTGELKISVTDGKFTPGETVVGYASSAIYTIDTYDRKTISDKYSQNDEIEEEADLILDFSQSNPFGVY
jgi:hypothetical protein